MTQIQNDVVSEAAIDIQTLPKISLHDHLDGGVRPATILELAAEIGHGLPAADSESLGTWFRESADSGSLERYLETFDHTIAVMQTREGLIRVAREFVEDLALDGVVYGEVRWAPEQHTQKGLTLDEAVEAVQEGLKAGVAASIAAGRVIQVGQLITAMRHADRGQEIAELAVRHRDRGAVGFDIAGAENGFPPSRFADVFTFLASEQFPVTIHAGEASGLDSIQDALISGRALRLGHGVRIAEDIDFEESDDDESDDESAGEDSPDGAEVGIANLGRIASWVRDRGIPLELCPSSNLQTGAIAAFGETIDAHPFDLLYQLGFKVTVNTDNRLMSGVTLTGEFELLVDTFGYELGDLLELTLNAVDAAFLPLDDREALGQHVATLFDAAARGATA